MKPIKLFAVITLLISALGFNIATSSASDHIDGPVTTKHRVGDLTDLYAFPTPGKTGFLSIILNTYPLVEAAGHFSEKVTYNFILRKARPSIGFLGSYKIKKDKTDVRGTAGLAQPTAAGLAQGLPTATELKAFQTSDEVVITCTFKTPEVTANHVINCKSSNGLSSSAKYETVTEESPPTDIRIFSGMRSDPFFFNLNWATSTSKKGRIPPPASRDDMEDTNILSIVLEVELGKLFKDQSVSMIAVAAEATTQDSPAAPVRRLDRVGRPEITNITLDAQEGKEELRDLYNVDRPFNVSSTNQKKYEDRLATSVLYYDNLDQQKNWDDPQRQAFASILADDFLVVDVTKSCNTPTFFEIEKSVLMGQSNQTCGGRKPNDDIMDVLFSLYISGVNGRKYSDGVDKPSKPVSEKFPYLNEPEVGFQARAKATLLRKLLGL